MTSDETKDREEKKEKPLSSRKRKQLFLRKFYIVWIGILSALILVVAVVANSNSGENEFKQEENDHWRSQAGTSAPGANGAAQTQVQTLEHVYNLIARNMNQTTVCITSNSIKNGTPVRSIGSGFIVSHQYVLTNLHVVKNASSLEITVDHGNHNKANYPAIVAKTDPTNDIALLKIQAAKNFPSVQFGDSSRVDAGDIVFAVGNPLGFGNTISQGIISDRRQSFSVHGSVYHDMLQTNTAIHHGSSGGPLVDISGKVIGINTVVYSPNGNFTGIGFAIPISRARSLFSGIDQKIAQYPTRGMHTAALGCAVTPTAPGCTVVAARVPIPPPQVASVAKGASGAMYHCPQCNACRHIRCPVCNRNLVLGQSGNQLVCSMGHIIDMATLPSQIPCPSCSGVMHLQTNGEPFSLAV